MKLRSEDGFQYYLLEMPDYMEAILIDISEYPIDLPMVDVIAPVLAPENSETTMEEEACAPGTQNNPIEVSDDEHSYVEWH